MAWFAGKAEEAGIGRKAAGLFDLSRKRRLSMVPQSLFPQRDHGHSFPEDESRIREPQAAENFTVLRHIALARLKNEKTLKRGIETRRLKAGWDENYRAKLLFDVV